MFLNDTQEQWSTVQITVQSIHTTHWRFLSSQEATFIQTQIFFQACYDDCLLLTWLENKSWLWSWQVLTFGHLLRLGPPRRWHRAKSLSGNDLVSKCSQEQAVSEWENQDKEEEEVKHISASAWSNGHLIQKRNFMNIYSLKASSCAYKKDKF